MVSPPVRRNNSEALTSYNYLVPPLAYTLLSMKYIVLKLTIFDKSGINCDLEDLHADQIKSRLRQISEMSISCNRFVLRCFSVFRM